MARSTDSVDAGTARTVLSEVETAGRQYRVGRLLRRVDACGAGVSVASQCGRLFDDLSAVETRRVGRLLAAAGDDGAFVLGELDEAGRARLVRLLGAGEMDAGDVQAMARMLRGERGIRGERVEASDLLTVANQGDIQKTMRVAKPDNSAPLQHDENVIWLENGKLVEAKKADGWVHDDSGAGWKHISNNRLHDQGDINQFLKYGSVYSNSNQVKKLLMDAVRNGRLYLDAAGDSTDIWYIYRVPETDKKVSVLIGDNGYIVNALPTDVSS